MLSYWENADSNSITVSLCIVTKLVSGKCFERLMKICIVHLKRNYIIKNIIQNKYIFHIIKFVLVIV